MKVSSLLIFYNYKGYDAVVKRWMDRVVTHRFSAAIILDYTLCTCYVFKDVHSFKRLSTNKGKAREDERDAFVEVVGVLRYVLYICLHI